MSKRDRIDMRIAFCMVVYWSTLAGLCLLSLLFGTGVIHAQEYVVFRPGFDSCLVDCNMLMNQPCVSLDSMLAQGCSSGGCGPPAYYNPYPQCQPCPPQQQFIPQQQFVPQQQPPVRIQTAPTRPMVPLDQPVKPSLNTRPQPGFKGDGSGGFTPDNIGGEWRQPAGQSQTTAGCASKDLIISKFKVVYSNQKTIGENQLKLLKTINALSTGKKDGDNGGNGDGGVPGYDHRDMEDKLNELIAVQVDIQKSMSELMIAITEAERITATDLNHAIDRLQNGSQLPGGDTITSEDFNLAIQSIREDIAKSSTDLENKINEGTGPIDNSNEGKGNRDNFLIIYLTSTDCVDCIETNEIIGRMIEDGFNIRIVTLQPREVSGPSDLPRLAVFPSGRNIRGEDNVRVYLSGLVK